MNKTRFTMAAVLVGAIALTACTGTKKNPDSGNQSSNEPTATFKYLLTAKPTTFDPAMVSDVPTMQILGNVYSGLVHFNDKGEIEKDLAESYEISTDGKTYTFKLKDAKFHDGSKVTAEDFKRAMVRAINPALGSPVADTYLDDIAGIAKFLGKRGEIQKQVNDKKLTKEDGEKQTKAAYDEMTKNPGVVAKDEKTLEVTIDEAKAFFLAKLAYPTAWAVSKSAPADKPIDPSPENIKLMIGSGPFKAESFDNAKFVLKRNADFYGEKAKVATVEMPIMEADQARIAGYRSGQLQVAPIPPADYPKIKTEAALKDQVLEFASARINYYALNQAVFEPAKDIRVRQAFNYGVDKDKLNDIVFAGTQSPAYGVMPDGIPGNKGKDIQGLKFDAAKAKDLLKQAGYGDGGKPFPTLKMTYRANNETSKRLAEFLQNQYQTNLGIKIELDPMEWGALLKASAAKNQLQSFTLGWSADYIDPQDFMTILLHSKAPYNRYGYNNKDVDSTLEKADRAKPGNERFAEYGKAEQIAVTDAAWVPTTFAKELWLVKPEVKGFRYNVMGIMPLNQITVSK